MPGTRASCFCHAPPRIFDIVPVNAYVGTTRTAARIVTRARRWRGERATVSIGRTRGALVAAPVGQRIGRSRNRNRTMNGMLGCSTRATWDEGGCWTRHGASGGGGTGGGG